ncbi:MAG TPA: hypothetical protein VKM36_05205 [Balneolaceae bacterium]|nr:hypothetical protein [Balneolaceae bacterium]
MAVFFVFIDGVGVGSAGPENPLSVHSYSFLRHFTKTELLTSDTPETVGDTTLYKTIDANLDVEGLPQSGTGQTALFTGENTSKKIGKHFGPFPHSEIKPLLKRYSIFQKVKEIGLSPHFLNAYPDIFFKKAEEKNRWSATTLMAKSCGLPLNRLSDVQNGKAITAEITQNIWRTRLKLDVPDITVQMAAQRALTSLSKYDLVLFEYYLTDKAGHSMEMETARKVLNDLEGFLTEIIENIGEDDTLVITSDHGNLEDLSVKTHTRNPVPLLVHGDVEPFRNCKSIMDVTPAILKCLDKKKA